MDRTHPLPSPEPRVTDVPMNCRWTCLAIFALWVTDASAAEDRPNVVWIVGEDMGPELGCYGDPNAITPNMDRLAREGVRFTRAFTHARSARYFPSRSGLITGRYPTSIGTHHMRSTLLKPPPMFTDELRKAGYLICWPTQSAFSKTDFNFELPGKSFDVVTDWTKDVPRDRPFFGFFNITLSHESQIRATPEKLAQNLARLTEGQKHDPARMRVPAFYPDSPVIRRDLANYYDLVTAVDHKVGNVLDPPSTARRVGDRTVVILTGDHGRGMPRSKRWVYDSGTHVPLIIRWPGHIKPGSVRDDLACFLDLPATTVALAGVEVPARFQGRVLVEPKIGPAAASASSPLGDRMDETFDRIRGVRGTRFRYVHQLPPRAALRPADQLQRRESDDARVAATPRRGESSTRSPEPSSPRSSPPKSCTTPEADPDEVRNLAADPKFQDQLQDDERSPRPLDATNGRPRSRAPESEN